MSQWTFSRMGTGLPAHLATIALLVPDCVTETLRRPAGELS
jgi:hypothetical protein